MKLWTGERRCIANMSITITPEQRERAIGLLTPELEAVMQRMRELAGVVAAEFNLPALIASLWLTDLTRQASAVRDREAVKAEVAGRRQLDLSSKRSESVLSRTTARSVRTPRSSLRRSAWRIAPA